MNRKVSTLYIVLCAFFTALVFVATFFINISAAFFLGAGGNINVGDAVIFISSAVLGPVGGMIAGGVGAAVADLAGGYVIYAPFTALIKGLAGFLCGLVYKKAVVSPGLKRLLSMLTASIVIVVGYFFTEMTIIVIAGSVDESVMIAKAALTFIPNLIQVGLSMLIAFIALPKIIEISAKSMEKDLSRNDSENK